MSPDVARIAVERLLAEADPARPITIGFLGGEPLRNRPLIRAIVEWTSRRARRDTGSTYVFHHHQRHAPHRGRLSTSSANTVSA